MSQKKNVKPVTRSTTSKPVMETPFRRFQLIAPLKTIRCKKCGRKIQKGELRLVVEEFYKKGVYATTKTSVCCICAQAILLKDANDTRKLYTKMYRTAEKLSYVEADIPYIPKNPLSTIVK
jgi:hypothetical protein